MTTTNHARLSPERLDRAAFKRETTMTTTMVAVIDGGRTSERASARLLAVGWSAASKHNNDRHRQRRFATLPTWLAGHPLAGSRLRSRARLRVRRRLAFTRPTPSPSSSLSPRQEVACSLHLVELTSLSVIGETSIFKLCNFLCNFGFMHLV